jgi:hypothetical protein
MNFENIPVGYYFVVLNKTEGMPLLKKMPDGVKRCQVFRGKLAEEVNTRGLSEFKISPDTKVQLVSL